MEEYKEKKQIGFEKEEYTSFSEIPEKNSVKTDGIQKEAEEWKATVGGSIVATPVIINNKIYFGACDKNFYCLSLEGKTIWKFSTGAPILSSASVRDGIVFFGCDDGYFYALDSETGELRWKFLTGDSIFSSPAIVNGMIYFGSTDGYFYVLNIDGKLVWKFLTGGRITCSPAVVNDAVFFNSYDRRFYSISTDGRILWKFQLGGPGGSPPTIGNDRYEEVWSFQKYNAKEPRQISINEGSIYFGSWDNHRYALDIDNGKLKWQFITGGLTSSPSALYKKTIFFGSFDTYFYALSAENGNLLWKIRTSSHVSDQKPVIHDNVIYFGSFDQHIYAFSLEGKESWRFMTGGPVESSPVIYNDTLFIGSFDTYLYAIDIKTRKVLWKFQTGFPFMSPFADILEKIVKVTEKRFTTWKPEIFSPTGKIYKPDIASTRMDAFSESHPYLMKTPYTMDTPYTAKKKKV